MYVFKFQTNRNRLRHLGTLCGLCGRIEYFIWISLTLQLHSHFEHKIYVYEGIDICLRDIAVYYSTIYLKYL